MERRKLLSLATLSLIGTYALIMGIWSITLKYRSINGDNVTDGWETLDRFVPSNPLAYLLIGVVLTSFILLTLDTCPRKEA